MTLRLEIGMRDAALVSRRQRVSQGQGDVEELPQRHPGRRDQRVECPSFHQLHREKRDGVGFFRRMNGDDVGVIQGGNRARFPAKTLEPDSIARHVRRQDFDRDLTSQPRVVGPVNFAHSTRAERADDLVRTQAFTSGQAHALGSRL